MMATHWRAPNTPRAKMFTPRGWTYVVIIYCAVWLAIGFVWGVAYLGVK